MILKNKRVTACFLFLILSMGTVSSVSAVDMGEDVDWANIDYGITDQGVACEGEPFEISQSFAGVSDQTVHTLTKDQYKEMWKKINKWQVTNPDSLPNYVDVAYMHVGMEKITKSQYLDMKQRWEAYIKEHGTEPTIIGVEGSSISGNSNKPDVKAGSVQKSLMDAVGDFTTFTGFYKLCKKRGYAFYLNNKYGRESAIKRLKNRQGLNCVDSAQLGYALAKEMGYEVKFQESWCSKDGVGHVFLKVKGKEFGNNWVIVDLAACMSVNSAAELGKHWCGIPHDAHHNWIE
jgi:hypothetical protein